MTTIQTQKGQASQSAFRMRDSTTMPSPADDQRVGCVETRHCRVGIGGERHDHAPMRDAAEARNASANPRSGNIRGGAVGTRT